MKNSITSKIECSSYCNSIGKRVFDLSFTFFIIPIATSLVLLVLLVYPFFGGFKFLFKHLRVGKNGKVFFMYKIRSLQVGHNSLDSVGSKADLSVLPGIGSILRQSRLDELPQIWNILRGDMSWVGPRPEQANFVEEYNASCASYNQRHLVRPGITGLAQIHNPDATNDDYLEKLTHDLKYIETASLWLDVQILWKSLVVVFRN